MEGYAVFSISITTNSWREIIPDYYSANLEGTGVQKCKIKQIQNLLPEINQANIENQHRIWWDFTTASVFSPGQLPGNKELVTRTLFH